MVFRIAALKLSSVIFFVGACAPSAEDQAPVENNKTPVEDVESLDASNDDRELAPVGGSAASSSSSHEGYDDIAIPQPVAGSWLSCARIGQTEAECEIEAQDLEDLKNVEGEIRWVARWEDGSDLPDEITDQIRLDVSDDGMQVRFSFGDLEDDIQDKIILEVFKGDVSAGKSKSLSELPKVSLDEEEVEEENTLKEQKLDEAFCENGSRPDKRGRWLVCISGWSGDICPEGQKVQNDQYCPIGN